MLIVTVKLLCLILTSSTPVEVMPDGPVAEGFQAAQEPTSQEELAVYTILSWGSPEELEASLAGGYPTPEIIAILEDESIPEEDRYWLDCRVRALIAMELHTFFDRNGYPVTFDAEWIMPGESYWRETFILNRPGCEHNRLSFTTRSDGRVDPGLSLDRFGEKIGEYVHSGITSRLYTARNGAIAAGAFPTSSGYQPVLIYNDGTYIVSTISMDFGLCRVSNSGRYVIVASSGTSDLGTGEERQPKAVLLDRYGNIVWETELEMTPIGNPAPTISPDDRYCAIVTQAEDIRTARVRGILQVFDMETGLEAWRIENPPGSRVSYSPDGRILFLPGRVGNIRCFDTHSGNELWTDRRISDSALSYASFRTLSGSNNAELLTARISPVDRFGSAFLGLLDSSGRVLAIDNIDGCMDVSPNGVFSVSENYSPYSSSMDTVTPVVIRRLGRCE